MPAFNADLGSSVATSYISVAQADDYYLGTMREPDWSALTQQEKEAALIAATRGLETLDYAGTRCTPASDDPALEQALQWPRSDATCRGLASTCAMLPRAILEATAYLALQIHASPPSLGSAVTGAVGAIQSQRLGDLEQSFYDVREGASTKVDASAPLILQQYPILVDMLSCWSASSTGSGGIALRVRS